MDKSAAIYNIVETAKANDLNVYTYLNYVLERMPNMNWAVNPEVLEALMPWNNQVQQACR